MASAEAGTASIAATRAANPCPAASRHIFFASDSAFPLLGGSTTATVTLSGPAPVGGLAIQLEGSQESVILGLLGGLLKVVVPNEVIVPEGATSADFNVTASLLGTLTSLLTDHDGSITATLNATVKDVGVVIEGAL